MILKYNFKLAETIVGSGGYVYRSISLKYREYSVYMFVQRAFSVTARTILLVNGLSF